MNCGVCEQPLGDGEGTDFTNELGTLTLCPDCQPRWREFMGGCDPEHDIDLPPDVWAWSCFKIGCFGPEPGRVVVPAWVWEWAERDCGEQDPKEFLINSLRLVMQAQDRMDVQDSP
jgi:hypothetical protein